jgi:hypothetical protein
MTFTELKSNIADWLNRTDLTSVIPTFIQLAEARLNRQLRTTNQYTRATVSSSDQYLSMPDDFLEMRHIRITSPKERDLVEIAAHQINEYTDTDFLASLADSYPRYFVYGQSLRIIPTPAESITYEMLYYAKVPALSTSNTSNWVSTSHPDAYLYYSLLQASPYLGEDERIAIWTQQAERAVAEIQASDDRRRTKGSRHSLNFQAMS